VFYLKNALRLGFFYGGKENERKMMKGKKGR
jgi:hypothetical protein